MERLVVTHAHLDHFGLAGEVLRRSGGDLWKHRRTELDLAKYDDREEAVDRRTLMLADHGLHGRELTETSEAPGLAAGHAIGRSSFLVADGGKLDRARGWTDTLWRYGAAYGPQSGDDLHRGQCHRHRVRRLSVSDEGRVGCGHPWLDSRVRRRGHPGRQPRPTNADALTRSPRQAAPGAVLRWSVTRSSRISARMPFSGNARHEVAPW